ncbi:unnamed protein product, partial [Symbiodinium necroappetens]
ASTADALLRAAGHCFDIRALLRQHRKDHTAKLLGDADVPMVGGMMCGLDLHKAFDALPHSEILLSLTEAGVPSPLAGVIAQAHMQTRCVVRHGGVEREVCMSRGLRQGCPIAPIVYAAWSCRLCRLVDQRLDRDWMANHGTLFADDIFSCWEIRTVQALKRAVRDLHALIETLQSLGMEVNCQKSVVVLKLCGKAVAQACKHLLVWREGVQLLRLRGEHNQNDIYIPCQSSMPYLGAALSYDNFELQTFKTRAAQAKSRFQELRRVLCTDGAITCRHRLRLYKAIIWPTLWYSLASVGVTIDVLKGVCSLLAVQLRKVLRIHEEGISNKTVLEQAGLDPHAFFRWQAVSKGESILSDRRRAENIKVQESKHCYRVHQCLLQFEDTSTSMMTTLVRVPNVEAVSVACPVCGVYYDSQASLQMHMKHKHQEVNVKARLHFRRDLHALHGLPICRFCQIRLFDWRSLEKHITEGTCPRIKELVAQGLSESAMLQVVEREEKTAAAPVAPPKATTQQTLIEKIDEALKVTPQELETHGGRLRILATHCALCRQLVADGSKMKNHWQRTHVHEWDRVSSGAIAGSKSLSATFSRPCVCCGSQAKSSRDHSGKCTSMFQLLAVRELRQKSFSPEPSRGPSEKQSSTDPQYKSFDVAKTPIGQFFKRSSNGSDGPSKSVGVKQSKPSSAVVIRSEESGRSQGSAEDLPDLWLPRLVLGNPNNHCYMNASVIALLHAAQVYGCSTRALLSLRGVGPLMIVSMMPWNSRWSLREARGLQLEENLVWEARYVDPAGIQVPHTGFQPISRKLRIEACSLQALVHDWSSQGYVHAVVMQAGPLLLHIVRNAEAGKNCTRVFLEATVRIPFFVEGVSVEWRPYKVVSVVEHHGASVDSGHYRSLLKTSDGWLHSDDSIVAAPALWSAEREALMYLLWLVPAQEAGVEQYMPAGIQLRPGTPTALSDATTVEERDPKAPRFADPKKNGGGGGGKGREGQASGSKDGGGNGNGGGAHQGMKRNYQPWRRTGGWKKDEWRDDWFSAKDGATASATDMQEVHKVLGVLQRLALRHEDSINLLKLEYSFVAHMKIGVPASVVGMLYVAADGWRKLKESEPAKLDRPMSTSLFVCFFAELKARLTGLEQQPDDVEKMAAMGWLNPGPPMTWAYLKWDQGNQRNVVDTDKPPLRTAEILEQVDTLLANVVANNSLARFHPTRPLSSDMQGDNVVFLIQVGTATDSPVNLRNGLQALCHNSVLQVVATQLKADRPMRSALANNLAATIRR